MLYTEQVLSVVQCEFSSVKVLVRMLSLMDVSFLGQKSSWEM